MYSKIAINNVKKSFKDYTIYFLTLTFAVCIFYSFNSIVDQKVMIDATATDPEIMKLMIKVVSTLSVFVSFILGGLILYANNFLIKKRKKELGVYTTLGMAKKKISRILVLETIIIGFISLVVGLFIGIIASQGLSILTAKLFEIPMSGYSFVMSWKAILKTVIYFSIIFIAVILFNTIIISKYKLIDLLTASRKNENIKLKNPIISIVIFVIGVVILAGAYTIILKYGIDLGKYFFSSIVLGVVGTVFFFYGLAGFLLSTISNNKNIYFKNLNIFVTRQISGKINTNFVSMATISLMLFVTIELLASGISFKSATEIGLEKTMPYDMSAYLGTFDKEKQVPINKAMDSLNLSLGDEDKYALYNLYTIGNGYKEILEKYEGQKFSEMIMNQMLAIKSSDYNKIRTLKNNDAIELASDEILLTSDSEKIIPSIKKLIESGDTVTIEGKEYKVKNDEMIEESFENMGSSNNYLTLIMPDKDLEPAKIDRTLLNIKLNGEGKEEREKVIAKELDASKAKEFLHKEGFSANVNLKSEIIQQSKGITTMILFVGIYLGIVFLIASAAVLALQQLSEASDSEDRYIALRKIGATEKMINKTIFTQTFIYFMLPISLALVHSVVGIIAVSELLKMLNKPNIVPAATITVLLILVVYGGYFLATYTGYKSIVKKK